MPMRGGVELAQLLKSHHRGLRVVFTSGYAYGLTVPPEDLQGESSFLEKPYTPDGMSWKIREALDMSTMPPRPTDDQGIVIRQRTGAH